MAALTFIAAHMVLEPWLIKPITQAHLSCRELLSFSFRGHAVRRRVDEGGSFQCVFKTGIKHACGLISPW